MDAKEWKKLLHENTLMVEAKYDSHIDVYGDTINKLSDKEYKLLDKWQQSKKIKAKTFVMDYEIWYNSSDKDVSKLMDKIKIK